jgi:rRNA maturation endonuclease Nob1
MQNVLLQMGLKLLSVQGSEVTRTKSWVTRCGACFAVYGTESAGAKVRGERASGGGGGRERLFPLKRNAPL